MNNTEKETLKRKARLVDRSFITTLEYKDKMDLYSKGLEFMEFVRGVDKKRLSEAEKKALIYYILYGCTKDTIKTLANTTNLDRAYIRTINSNLRTKGYLVKDKNNSHKSHLTDIVKEFKEYMDGGNFVFTTVLVKSKKK